MSYGYGYGAGRRRRADAGFLFSASTLTVEAGTTGVLFMLSINMPGTLTWAINPAHNGGGHASIDPNTGEVSGTAGMTPEEFADIWVSVTNGTDLALSSTAAIGIVMTASAAPAFTSPPSISGTATENSTLTMTDGDVVGGTITGRQWLADGVAIPGETGSQLILRISDVGKVITARNTATATTGGATSSADSLPTAAVAREYVWGLDPAAQGTTTNGASLNNLTELVTGGQIVKLTAAAATYQSNVTNGLPCIRLNLSGYTLDRTINAALITALDARVWTLTVVAKSLSASSIRWLLGIRSGATTRLQLSSAAEGLVVFDSASSMVTNQVTFGCTDTGLHVFDFVTKAGFTAIYVDGNCVGSINTQISSTNGGTPTLFCYDSTTTYAAIGDIYGMYVYPTAHRPRLIFRRARALRAKYGLGSATKIAIIAGNSLVQGVNANTIGKGQYNISQSVKTQLGGSAVIDGAYGISNMGHGAYNWDSLSSVAADEIDDMVAEFGSANVLLCVWEGINDLVSNTAIVSANKARDYCLARIAAGVLPENLHLGTIVGVGTARPGFNKYPAYVTELLDRKANTAGLANINLMRFDTDPGNHVGLAPDANTNGGYYGRNSTGANGSGANPDGGDGVYTAGVAGGSSDNVHRTGVAGHPGTPSGYPYMAQVWYTPVIQEFFGL